MPINLAHAIKELTCLSLVGEPINRELSIVTDTRKVVSDCLYVAIKGDRFDGYDFIEDALSLGARAVLYNVDDRRIERVQALNQSYPQVMFIGVEDTINYLQRLAQYKRQQWYDSKKHVVGITGSNGKTTSKEMLSLLFQAVPSISVQATVGNLNNHIGVPLTILALQEETTVSLLEMGMNHPGEIEVLCDIGRPTSGVITNIGTAHIEYLGSQEGIFEEKSALYRSVIQSKETGVFVINELDEYCIELKDSGKTIRSNQNNIISIIELSDEEIKLKSNDKSYTVHNPSIYGKHLYQNLGLCIVLVSSLYPKSIEQIISRAKEIKLPANNRSEWIERDSKLIFLDAYNANPQSMLASLEVFKKRITKLNKEPSSTLIIIGDMNELGDFAQQGHSQVGQKVKDLEFSNVVFVGKYKKYFAFACPGTILFETKAELEAWLKSSSISFKTIFIKGSRSLQLESLVDIV